MKIEEETAYALSYSGKLKVRPYLWFVPSYADKNISVFSATKTFDYCGIKLHPAAQKWNFENPRLKKCMEEIFDWSAQNKKPVLVHSGTIPVDLPTRFSPFAIERPDSVLILAHSNPVKECAELVNTHKNIFCDTACIQKKNLEKLRSLVRNKEKILFGSDFPVTHYITTHSFGRKYSLKEEYLLDCKIMP
ncbi:MAG: amidohydrolase family protein [Treponema sp.]|nr:amidohydrolase family protein [Treponema sp.]